MQRSKMAKAVYQSKYQNIVFKGLKFFYILLHLESIASKQSCTNKKGLDVMSCPNVQIFIQLRMS